MKLMFLAIWTLNLLFVLSVRSVADEAKSFAAAQILKIPSADPKWENTNNFTDPNCPTVWLSQHGAFVNGSQTPIPFDQVLVALAAIPRQAWGHGRFVIFIPFPPGVHSSDETDPPGWAVKKVLDELRSVDIRMNHNIASA